jgi:catalase
MPQSRHPSARSPVASLVAIAVIVGVSAVAFAYTAGWLSPVRLTPAKIVDALAPPGGPALGHRRNHAKGICFTGVFESNGAGTSLSTAAMFASGQYPVLGRFNLGTPNPNASDATVRVRGIGFQISTPAGRTWRSAMINAPVFPVSTPQGFYDLLSASGSKDPGAMKAFGAAHPEFANFLTWATTAPWTSSYAEDRFNSLDSFIFTDASGKSVAVRWSLIPAAQPVAITPGDLAKRGPDYLESEIAARVGKAPQSWTLAVTVADPGDPTADPSKAWPADRRSVVVGTLVAQQVEPEADGPCRDINFDPTVLPAGMTTSDDPFPAARSAAYAVSYDRRTAEAADYPRTAAGGVQ